VWLRSQGESRPQKWRDLIKQAWNSDPLECPVCQKELRLIAVIEDPAVIEKILRHLKLWCGPARFNKWQT
jgi:hypothetical protein